jgi:hypothetical protein
METDHLVRWLYALGIGFLMFSTTLLLFLTYRFTDEAFFAAIVCAIMGVVLCVGGFVLSRVGSRAKKVARSRD